MFKKYLLLTFRSVWHNKAYSAINIIGFAIGMAACFLITLWVRDELSFDSYHVKSDRIYRILAGDDEKLQPRTPHPPAVVLPEAARAWRNISQP